MLQEELEKYRPGICARACMVITNKTDLLGGDGDLEEVRLARARLAQLKDFVKTSMNNDGRTLDVVPTSVVQPKFTRRSA